MNSFKKRVVSILFLLPLFLVISLFLIPCDKMIAKAQAEQEPVLCMIGQGQCSEVMVFICISDICDNGPEVLCLVCITAD